jgi:hypothetical protein
MRTFYFADFQIVTHQIVVQVPDGPDAAVIAEAKATVGSLKNVSEKEGVEVVRLNEVNSTIPLDSPDADVPGMIIALLRKDLIVSVKALLAKQEDEQRYANICLPICGVIKYIWKTGQIQFYEIRYGQFRADHVDDLPIEALLSLEQQLQPPAPG